MNAVLIKNWNRVVTPQDTVYHLGDFAFAEPNVANNIGWQLNGTKFLIPGNHDKRKITDALTSFEGILPTLFEFTTSVEDEKIHFVLCHFALRVWNKSHHGAIHLYGHSHGTLPEDANSLSCDVGVDSWDFTPVSINQILTKMYKKAFKPKDHHGR